MNNLKQTLFRILLSLFWVKNDQVRIVFFFLNLSDYQTHKILKSNYTPPGYLGFGVLQTLPLLIAQPQALECMYGFLFVWRIQFLSCE